MVCAWPVDSLPNGPSFRARQSTSSKSDGPRLPVLIPLHLPIHNPYMYYMSSLFYLHFAMLKHAFLYHLPYHWNHLWHIYLSSIVALVPHIICISLKSIMVYLFIKHHLCRDRDARVSVSWPGGPDPTSDDAACSSSQMVDARGNTVTHGFILVPAVGPYVQQRDVWEHCTILHWGCL